MNLYTIANFLLKLKLNHETWDSVFKGNDVNIIFNSILNIFLWHYYSSFPVIKTNKLANDNSWITAGIQTSCKHKNKLYIELRNINKSHFKKIF